jgi:hypothetical protein
MLMRKALKGMAIKDSDNDDCPYHGMVPSWSGFDILV